MDVDVDSHEASGVQPARSRFLSGHSTLERLGLSGWDATALVAALLLVVAYFPTLMFEAWTPRMVVVLAFGVAAQVLLVTLAVRRDLAAMLLLAAAGWTVLASLLSDAPRSSLVGVVGRDMSGLVVILSAGLWALGRVMSAKGRVLLVQVLVWALTVNAIVGLLQYLLDVDTGPLALAYGRPTGFDSNPVYFGGLCAAGVAAAQSKWVDSWRAMAVPIALLGMAVSVSGSRVALAAVVVTAVAIAAWGRSRSAIIGLAVVFGALAAGVVLDQVKGAGVNAVGRLGQQSSDGRLDVWRYGLQAWTDRPLTGYGFGQFRPAVQGRFSADFVRVAAQDETTQAWFDAHNVGITLLVSVGVVGAALFAAWALYWARTIRGPLVWMVVALVLHWMLQPISLYTLPIAMLVFGAASRSEPDAPPSGRVAIVPVATVGAFAALWLLIGDVLLQDAANDVDAPRAADAAQWFGGDPIVDDIVAQVFSFDADVPDRKAIELEWRVRIAEHEPDRPFWWSQLALVQIQAGRFDEADESIARAYELQPFNTRTLRAEMVLAAFLGDVDRLERILRDSCDLGMEECELSADDLLAEFDDALQGEVQG